MHPSIDVFGQRKLRNPYLRYRLIISIKALMVEHLLIHDDRFAIFARIFHEIEHEKSTGICGDLIAPLHIDVNTIAIDSRLVFLSLNPSLK